eukprot:Tamp_13997.p1 GENE.Tamp_13997~~Tamp_13997.p1  ORF type:complete len:536 (+),score=108.33 Tamp_13997:156-1610(+)
MAEKLQMAQRADQEHRSVAASDRANAQKRIERAAEQLQEAMQERQALEQQLAKQQRFAETRAQSQAAQMEHMQSKLNEMLEKLEQVQRENLEMAEQVHNFSRLVEGEEASRKIIAAQSAAQENAIANMHAQRKELNGQLEDANRRLSDAAAELKRLSGQHAKMNALEEQLQHLQAVESRAKMQIQQADERMQNMERALFDSRQSAAEKDKKIAHLEAKIGSTDTRGSQIFSPREDAPSPQKFEAPQISATLVREPKGPDLLPRASPHDWINYSAPERPSRRIHELQPACSVGDREISNRVPEIAGGGGPGYVRAPPVPVRSGQYEDENTSESPYRIAAPAPLLPQRSTRPGGRSSPPAAVAPHAPSRYSPPQFQYRQQQGAMQHLSNPAPSERGGMGGVVMNSNTNAKNYHQQQQPSFGAYAASVANSKYGAHNSGYATKGSHGWQNSFSSSTEKAQNSRNLTASPGVSVGNPPSLTSDPNFFC